MKKRIIALLLSLVLIAGYLPAQAGAASTEKKLVAITFDDGPSKYTDGLLDELAKRDVLVTFFMQGCNAERYPAVVKKAYEAGHQIASHTYDHPQLTKLTDKSIQDQLTNTDYVLNTAIGVNNSYMLRPPYGSADSRVLSAIGKPAILWSVDTLDWKSRNTDAVYQQMVNNTKDGSIVLLHDLYSTSVSGALRGIDALLEQGYEFVTVEELLRRRGRDVTDGEIYYNAPSSGTNLPAITQPTITASDVAGGKLVTLSADGGAPIYYTTDGAVPNAKSAVYTAPFLLEGAATVKALAAYDFNGGRSRASEAKFDLPQSAPPVITLTDDLAAISAEGEIHYTLDGSVPTPDAARYSDPIPVAPGTVIRAVAAQPGYGSSSVSSLLYSDLGNIFSDVLPGEWFYSSVDGAVSQGLMSAVGTEFSPRTPATRRELVTVLYALAGRPDSGGSLSFSDVSDNDPDRDAITWAVEQHVLTGFDDNTFRPDDSVTRQQLAVMLYRAQPELPDSVDVPAVLGMFDDAESIQSYAQNAVAWAVSSGILNGVSDTAFSPGGTVIRAQLAAIALRCQPLLQGPADNADGSLT